MILFFFQVKALRGSADFFALNHYTTALLSPPKVELDWKVPSLAHDVGVKVEVDPSWSVSGPDWLFVSFKFHL